MTRVFAFLLIAAAGCGPSSGRGNKPGGGATLASIEVQPPNATVAVDDSGAPAPIGYTAVGHFSDGHSEPLGDAVFALDSAGQKLGAFAGAAFTASGGAAGTGMVSASAQGKVGSTGVTVTVSHTRLGPGVPSDAPGKLGGTPTQGALSPLVVYPLDGAVMPTSVASPDVQWEGTAQMGDLFRVRLVAGMATVELIVANAAGFTWDALPTAADWSLLTQSAAGGTVAVTVDHWDAQSGIERSNPVSVKLVEADVRGAIYYWDLSEGKMQRIDDSGRNLAIPNPPPNPKDGTRCVACHVISRDGRYLAGELWGGSLSGAVFDLANPQVGTGNPAPTMTPLDSYISLFSTFNPDATRLIVNKDTSLAVVDPKTGGAVMTFGTPLPTTKAAHPTWSPDGSLVAFINNLSYNGGDAAWAVDYTSGDLAIIPASTGDTFGAAQTLVASSKGDPAFAAPSWPTFTPDSQWIGYGAGTNSRGRNTVMVNGVNTEVSYPGALFLIGRAGGTPTRLDNACSGARNCYLPNFSPYDSGGYFWLVFYSLRDYGNVQAGTKGTQRRQMWVTAIDRSKLGQADPSSVPYWLPQQDAKTDNMSAFWALPPPLQ